MKDKLIIFLLAGIPFGTLIGLFMGITSNLLVGIMAGSFSGVLFGLFISAFVIKQSKKLKKRSSELIGSNNIIFEGGANHFVGVESVGGWLCLTAKELIFISHNFNVQNHQTAIPLNQISEVNTSLTLGVPNGLKIVTNSGVEKFVVYGRKKWVQEINKAILFQQEKHSLKNFTF